MVDYPSVNWWPGNLRPRESRLSFLARFAKLNGLSDRACLKFLKVDAEDRTPLPVDEIARLSCLHHESAPSIQAVFSHSIRFVDCEGYAPSANWNPRHFIRYCEPCSRYGYHSYLHEAGWLSKCPFHMTELKTVWIPMRGGTIPEQRIATLRRVMQKHNGTWPYYGNNDFLACDESRVASLETWVRRASVAAACMVRAEIWRSGDGEPPGDMSLAQVFGQLRALEATPRRIKRLLAEPGGSWYLERQAFPHGVRAELDRLKQLRLSFSRIFAFYKLHAALSSTSSLAARSKKAQDLLRKKHGSCRCLWAQIGRNTGESCWIMVRADKAMRWNYRCPFDVALMELKRGWGPNQQVLSDITIERERQRLIASSHDMHDAGLITYRQGARVTPEGYLSTTQSVWPCCDWIYDSPLLELLNYVAEWEIESALDALTTWLDDINRGSKPSERDDPKYCVRLCEADHGLALFRWKQGRFKQSTVAK